MGEVIQLGARGPYLTGDVRCLRCNHEWVGVSPVGLVDELECPACGVFAGVRRALIAPEDNERWRCNCGNELFVLTRTGAPLCPNCGLRANSWVDG